MSAPTGLICRVPHTLGNFLHSARCLRASFTHTPCHHMSTNVIDHETIETHRRSRLSHTQEHPEPDEQSYEPTKSFRDIYPDFLPEPNWQHRDRIAEKLEREDMYRRRMRLNVPEFYVGSVLAVTVADRYAPGKENRFLGIVISRGGHGLRSHFTLRNIIDGEGIEIRYDLYSPVIERIDVIKLEKRLDKELFYLRDAPQEHSYFPLDMQPIPLPKGSAVPLNTTKVKLGPRPWHERWERKHLEGVEDLELPQRFYDKAAKHEKPWEKHDLMMEYRGRINDEEVTQIEREFIGRKKIIDEVHGHQWLAPAKK